LTSIAYNFSCWSTLKRLDHIDSIRGIAVLLVVLVHSSITVPNLVFPVKLASLYGQMGVQLFFVASAFTLCLSYELRQHERQANLKYAIRRFFRIAPAYYLGIAFHVGFQAFQNLHKIGEVAVHSDHSFFNILSNVLLVHGFVPSANNSVVPGGWSIGTEVAFYVCFPVVYLFLKNIGAGRPGRSTIVVFAALLFSFGFNMVFSRFLGREVLNHRFLYFSLMNQLPVFIIGICYYLVIRDNLVNIPNIWSCVGLVVFTSLSLWMLRMHDFQYAFTLLPFLSAISFVFLMEIFRDNKVLNSSLLKKTGKLSYSIYLFHFVFAVDLAGCFTGKLAGYLSPEFALLVTFSTTVAISFLIALVMERYVERRSIQFGKTLINNLSSDSKQQTVS